MTLSGGQRQRVAIARTLLEDAPLLVLDDSLSAVDTRTEARIREAIATRRGRRTCIVIAHRLTTAREALSAHYLPELGEPFVTAGCCFYRDGRDSVAWHGDTIGRGNHTDTMVAIVSFGDPRRLALRPRGGGESISFEMGHGDLVVMGGSCQRTWEHAVPKVAHAGPRISVQFRPLNVF